MKIGVDLTPLQGPHRMRGIGYTVLCFINNLDADAKSRHDFVFYLHDDKQKDALNLLNLGGIDYEIRNLYPPTPIGHVRRRVWAYKKLKTLLRTLRVLWLGNSEGGDFSDVDWFLQFDQNKPLPSKRSVKSMLVLYDLIPYVLGHLYLSSYSVSRRNGSTRSRAIANQLKRSAYIIKASLIARKASKLVAISEHTKSDFVRFAHTKADKISVCLLGVSDEQRVKSVAPKRITKYVESSWGPLPKKVAPPRKPYLLFVGGADPRRKLVDVTAAYNILRAQGHDISLIMSGDTMFGPTQVANPSLQAYLSDTAYPDDILFLGFTDDNTKDWLYENALAFVFPSVYEGFGLPVLEAMRYGTPVITYNNSSISEIAGDAALYADGALGIAEGVRSLLADDHLRKHLAQAGMKQVSSFSWRKTVNSILDVIGDQD